MGRDRSVSEKYCKRTRPNEIMFMVNQLSRIFHHEMRKVCEENGVPVSYRGILFHLAHNDGCNQRMLAEKAGLKPSTVSITLDKMERDGYVSRERNAEDQRIMHVYLTEKGKGIHLANKKRIEELDARFGSTVSAEEKKQLIALLDKVMTGYCADQGMEMPYFIPEEKEE